MKIATLMTFGSSDPHNITLAALRLLRSRGMSEHVAVCIGPSYEHNVDALFALSPVSFITPPAGTLRHLLAGFDVVYCGTGATMLEAVGVGCDVQVLSNTDPIDFAPVWSCLHYDHNLEECPWFEIGVLAEMAREIRERRA